MPALTISTDKSSQSRSSSPTRPPVSPITPPLGPSRINSSLPQRQTFTHSQPDQVGVPPPPPEPISFDSNPDVIALKSAISVLQVQRKRATEDIQTLSRAMEEATEDPEAFMRDLVAGKTGGQQQPSLPNNPSGNGGGDDGDHEMEDDAESSKGASPSGERAWNSLPRPQNVVRSPPINWAQYAVVGDSLEKLHAEQVAQPTQGTPAVIDTHGSYEFKAADSNQSKYVGVAAPYAPGKDRIDQKSPRGKK